MRHLIIAMLSVLSLFSCSNHQTVAGGTTDTGNQIAGYIYRPDGSPAAHARVTLLNTDSLDHARETETLESGQFILNSVDTGHYLIEVNDLQSRACLIPCAIAPGEKDISLQPDTLRAWAALKGSIPPPIDGNTTVRIYGLERNVPVDSTGAFTIADLPAGMFRMRISSTSAPRTLIVIDSVKAVSGTEATVSDAGGRFSRRLYLNTTASGSNVASDVYGFPVLIRLSSADFNYAHAQAGGKDVRFTKPDGTLMPYLIERWDSAAGNSEIWVKVDTIRGNDSNQFFSMSWGNQSTSSLPSGSAVFDTADGFLGVWHLNGSGNDATEGGNHGTSVGATDSTGMIGGAKYFDGTDSIVIPGLLGKPASVSLSAWVRLDKADSLGAEVVTLGDLVVLRMDDSLPAVKGTWGAFYCDTLGGHTYLGPNSHRYLAQTGWHFLAFTIDNASHEQTLFIDGAQSAVANEPFPINYGSKGKNTVIGSHGYGSLLKDFTGMIDEVRISRVAHSADWIRLCYANQQEHDSLVVWK